MEKISINANKSLIAIKNGISFIYIFPIINSFVFLLKGAFRGALSIFLASIFLILGNIGIMKIIFNSSGMIAFLIFLASLLYSYLAMFWINEVCVKIYEKFINQKGYIKIAAVIAKNKTEASEKAIKQNAETINFIG